jgi:hypothetical protein
VDMNGAVVGGWSNTTHGSCVGNYGRSTTVDQDQTDVDMTSERLCGSLQ